jgi:hypothetical protein
MRRRARQAGDVTAFLDRLLNLWTEPLDGRADPAAAFRAVYADPVPVNGTMLTAHDLVARATAIQLTYEGLSHEVVHELETPGRLVIGFFMRGRHVGPLETPLGTVAPTGKEVTIQVTDILTISDSRVTDIWMMASDLSLLMQLGAVHLG